MEFLRSKKRKTFLHVETADDVGTFCGGERHELCDGSHFAAIVAHFDVVERLAWR